VTRFFLVVKDTNPVTLHLDGQTTTELLLMELLTDTSPSQQE